MTWFDSTVGRRLVVRLYLYQAALFACIVGTILVVGHLVVEPAMQAARREGLAWVVEDVLTQLRPVERVQRRIATLHARTGLRLTIFDGGGELLANTAPVAPAPLVGDSVARLARDGTLTISNRTFAVGAVEDGRLAAYGIVDWQSLRPPAWKGALVLAAVLVVLGIGSAVLARSIARPLERLAKVTHAFGLGDLRARANTLRKDEIGDLGRAFNQMADRVESLRRAEKELLANVSHELRTPLARIRVVLELAAGGDPQAAQRYLSEIAEDLTEIEQLLGDIITAARLDLSNERAKDPYPPLRLMPAPLAPLAQAMVRRFSEAHPERVLHSTIQGDPSAPIDRVMLKHALANVLDNAHKYSPPDGPIEFAVRVEDGQEGQIAVVEIRDHGRGIDPADVPHVFTAFFRADRSRSRGSGGVGLGLTLARRIIEAHGGSIDLESRVGDGTTVRILLPMRAAPG